MIKKSIDRAMKKASKIIWTVTITHILAGLSFLFLDIELAFFNSYSFLTFFAFNNPDHQHLWGIIFLIVAFLSISADFVRQTWSSFLLIPQQLIVMYGFFELLITVVRYGATDFFWLTLCLLGPLSIMHTIAVMQRCSKENDEPDCDVLNRIRNIVNQKIPD